MGSGGGGSSPEMTTTDALSSRQKSVERPLSKYLRQSMWDVAGGRPIEAFGPTTPLQPGEENFWYQTGPGDELAYQEMMSYAQNPTEYTSTSMIPQALMGLSPETTAQWYQQTILPYQQRMFEDVALPGIAEQYAGTGGFWSGARREAMAGAQEGFGTAMASELGREIANRQSLAIQMMPQIAQLEQMQAAEPLLRAESAYRAEEMQRQIRLSELQARFQEFARTRPEYSPVIQQALGYLNTQTIAAYGVPGSPGQSQGGMGAGIGGLLGAGIGTLVLPGVGTAIGAGLGASAGGAVGGSIYT